MDLQLKY